MANSKKGGDHGGSTGDAKAGGHGAKSTPVDVIHSIYSKATKILTGAGAGHEKSAAKVNDKHPSSKAAAPKENVLNRYINKATHAGGEYVAKAEKYIAKAEKYIAKKVDRLDHGQHVAHADKLSPQERSNKGVREYTDQKSGRQFHYDTQGRIDQIGSKNNKQTEFEYKEGSKSNQPISFVTTSKDKPEVANRATASESVSLKINQQTGDVTTTCYEPVPKKDQQQTKVPEEQKVERQFTAEGAHSKTVSDRNGRRLSKDIYGADEKFLARTLYQYSDHKANQGDKANNEQAAIAVQFDEQGRRTHKYVFANSTDIEKQHAIFREDQRHTEKGGIIKDSFAQFDVHTGKDIPLFKSEHQTDIDRGRSSVHEQSFRDGKKIEEKTIGFDQHGKADAFKYSNVDLNCQVDFTFSKTGKATDVNGHSGGMDKRSLLRLADTQTAHAIINYQIKAIESSDILAKHGPTEPRHGEKANGVVAWKEGDKYRQGLVKDGQILDADKKPIGTVNDNGDVQIGQTKFNILKDDGRAAVFHGLGTDGDRLDLCQTSNPSTKEESCSGYLYRGSEKMSMVGSNVFTADNKFLGHMDKNGKMTFAADLDQAEKNNTDLSSLKHGGWKFVGNQAGKPRQFDLDNAANGKIFVAPVDASGVPIRDKDGHLATSRNCDLQLGMIIDHESGKQIGKLIPPARNPDNTWGEGSIELFGSAPGEASITRPLSSMTNTVFDITLSGKITQPRMKGIVKGPAELQADGTPRPGSGGILDLESNLAISKHNMDIKAIALREYVKNEADIKGGISTALNINKGEQTMEYITGYRASDVIYDKANKEMGGEAQREATLTAYHQAQKQYTLEQAAVEDMLKTGQVDDNTAFKIQRNSEVDKISGLDPQQRLKQRIDNPQHVLENVPPQAAICDGYIKRPDINHPGKLADYDVRKSIVYEKDTNKIVGNVNPVTGKLRLISDSGAVESTQMADRALVGTTMHLRYDNGAGKSTSIDWVNSGDGTLQSLGQLRKQVAEERAYAELLAKGSKDGPTVEALARTKVLEDRYKKLLDNVENKGISDLSLSSGKDRFSTLEQLKGGPQSFVRAEALRPEHEAVTKIEIHKLNTVNDCKKVSGAMRLGHDHFLVENGQIFHAKFVNNEWRKEEKRPACGTLGTNYTAEIDGHKIVLQNQDQFLFQFTVAGQNETHRIIGLGAPRTDASGNVISGGLVEARELIKRADQLQKDSSAASKSYFESENLAVGGIVDSAMGGREAQLAQVENSSERQQLAINHSITSLFSEGLNSNTQSSSVVDQRVNAVQNFTRDMKLSADDASTLSLDGQDLQKQSGEAVAMVGLSFVPGGATLLAGRMGFGLAGRGALTMIGGGLVSTVARQTQDLNTERAKANFASGSVEALTMWAGSAGGDYFVHLKELQKLRVLGPEAGALIDPALKTALANPATSKLLTIMSKPGGTQAVEMLCKAACAPVQTAGFNTAGAIREGNLEQLSPEKLGRGMLYMFEGDAAAVMLHTVLPVPVTGFQKLVHGSIDSAVNNFTNSYLSAQEGAIESEKNHIAQEQHLNRELITDSIFERYKNDSRINAFKLNSAAEGTVVGGFAHPISHFVSEGSRYFSSKHEPQSQGLVPIEAARLAESLPPLAAANKLIESESVRPLVQNGLLTQLTGNNGQSISFKYNHAGPVPVINEIKHTDGTTWHSTDGLHWLNPATGEKFRGSCEASVDGSVKLQSGSSTMHFHSDGKTRYIDPAGGEYHRQAGDINFIKDAHGRETHLIYDDQHQVKSMVVRDKEGNQTWTRDQSGWQITDGRQNYSIEGNIRVSNEGKVVFEDAHGVAHVRNLDGSLSEGAPEAVAVALPAGRANLELSRDGAALKEPSHEYINEPGNEPTPETGTGQTGDKSEHEQSSTAAEAKAGEAIASERLGSTAADAIGVQAHDENIQRDKFESIINHPEFDQTIRAHLLNDFYNFSERIILNGGDRGEIGKTLLQVNRMLEATDAAVPLKDRILRAEEFLWLAGLPFQASQGSNPTCGVTALLVNHLQRCPSEAAKWLADLTTTGEVLCPDLTVLRPFHVNNRFSFSASAESNKHYEHRTKPNGEIIDAHRDRIEGKRVGTVEMLNHLYISAGHAHETNYKGHAVGRGNIGYYGGVICDMSTPVPTEIAPMVPGPNGTTVRSSNPGMTVGHLAKAHEKLSGRTEEDILLLNERYKREQPSDLRSLFSDKNQFASPEVFAEKLVEAARANRFPKIIQINVGHEPFRSDGGFGQSYADGGEHIVSILGIECPEEYLKGGNGSGADHNAPDPHEIWVSIDNQWSKNSEHIVNKVRLSDLFIATTKPGSLEHLTEIKRQFDRNPDNLDTHLELLRCQMLELEKGNAQVDHEFGGSQTLQNIRESIQYLKVLEEQRIWKREDLLNRKIVHPDFEGEAAPEHKVKDQPLDFAEQLAALVSKPSRMEDARLKKMDKLVALCERIEQQQNPPAAAAVPSAAAPTAKPESQTEVRPVREEPEAHPSLAKSPARFSEAKDSNTYDLIAYRHLHVEAHKCFQDNVIRKFVRDIAALTQDWEPYDATRSKLTKKEFVEQKRDILQNGLEKIFKDLDVVPPVLHIVEDSVLGNDGAAYLLGQGIIQLKESRLLTGSIRIEEIGHEGLGHQVQEHLVAEVGILDALRAAGYKSLDGLTSMEKVGESDCLKLTDEGKQICRDVADLSAKGIARPSIIYSGTNTEFIEKVLLASQPWLEEKLKLSTAELQADKEYDRGQKLGFNFKNRREHGDEEEKAWGNLLSYLELSSAKENLVGAGYVEALFSKNPTLPETFKPQTFFEALKSQNNRKHLFGYDPLEAKLLEPRFSKDEKQNTVELEASKDKVFDDFMRDPKLAKERVEFFSAIIEDLASIDMKTRESSRLAWKNIIREANPEHNAPVPLHPTVEARIELKACMYLFAHFLESNKKNGGIYNQMLAEPIFEGIRGANIGELSKQEFEEKLPVIVLNLMRDNIFVSRIKEMNRYLGNRYEMEAHYIHHRMMDLMKNNDLMDKADENYTDMTERQKEYSKLLQPHPGKPDSKTVTETNQTEQSQQDTYQPVKEDPLNDLAPAPVVRKISLGLGPYGIKPEDKKHE